MRTCAQQLRLPARSAEDLNHQYSGGGHHPCFALREEANPKSGVRRPEEGVGCLEEWKRQKIMANFFDKFSGHKQIRLGLPYSHSASRRAVPQKRRDEALHCCSALGPLANKRRKYESLIAPHSHDVFVEFLIPDGPSYRGKFFARNCKKDVSSRHFVTLVSGELDQG
jgi:hypothetical protein